jgi:chromatin segregation and condensation protein Rec8/ScpA/Scc1 (kleisin family)
LLAAHPEGGPLTGYLPAIGREEAGRTMKLRVALASTFAASLELARQQALQAEQSGNFAEITLRGAA